MEALAALSLASNVFQVAHTTHELIHLCYRAHKHDKHPKPKLKVRVDQLDSLLQRLDLDLHGSLTKNSKDQAELSDSDATSELIQLAKQIQQDATELQAILTKLTPSGKLWDSFKKVVKYMTTGKTHIENLEKSIQASMVNLNGGFLLRLW